MHAFIVFRIIIRRKNLIYVVFRVCDSDCSAIDCNVHYNVTMHVTNKSISERSEPSSRTFLNGEQPYPWDLLQPQDKMSRHRGAEHRRRYGLLGGTSLLSPG